MITARAVDTALSEGALVVLTSRMLCSQSKRLRRQSVGIRWRITDWLSDRRPSATRALRGASDRDDANASPAQRQVWRHTPTGHLWVVIVGPDERPLRAVGPFSAADWDPRIRDLVNLDGWYSIGWLREHLDEFERDDAATR